MLSPNKHSVAGLLLALASAAAMAAPPPSLASYSSARGLLGDAAQSPDDQNFSTYDLAEIIAGHVLTTSSASSAGSASGWASAAPGVLKAYNDLHVASLDSATVLERNYAGVLDVLHVSSATLPPGTPVDLQLHLVFTIAYTSSGLTNYMPVGVNATLSANDGTNSALLHTDGPTQANGQWGSGLDVVNAVFSTSIGADVVLDQRLAIDGQVSFLDGYGLQLTIDGGHTARCFVDAPGDVRLTAATGHDYATAAVPEPGSAALMAAGAALLAGLRRRRG